jgi:hypothetical protein
MLPKAFCVSGLLLLVIGLLWIGDPRIVHAQATTPEKDENCLACHENLYYLHDTGKWYCLCSLRARCTFCHGGDPDSLNEGEAHLGLVSQPTVDNAALCQSCHPDDYRSRVEMFASLGGIRTVQTGSPASHTAAVIERQVGTTVTSPILGYRELTPWQRLGAGMVGVLMLGVIYFGYRCWKFDRCNLQNQDKE